MTRLLLLVAAVATILLLTAASAAFGGAPWWENLSRVDALLSSLLAVGALGAFFLTGGRWLSRAVVRAPMRRAWRAEGMPRDRALREASIEAVVAHAAGSAVRPGRLLARLAMIEEAAGPRRWPWASARRISWFTAVSERLTDGLIPRLLSPDTSRAVAALCEAAARADDDFLHYRPVPSELLARTQVMPVRGAGDEAVTGVLFRDVATVLSGALVLADGVQCRGGAVHRLRVWHSHANRPSGTSFGATHALGARRVDGDRQECPWGMALATQAKTRAGDFDGRVVELEGVALVQDDRSEGVDILLRTRETCYAATEVIAAGPAGGTADLRCKGLDRESATVRSPRWLTLEPEVDGPASVHSRPDTLSARRVEVQTSRLGLLTAFAALVLQYPSTTHPGLDRSLVLAQRSALTRNGAGVLSVAGGGVVNLPVGSWPGDEDADGFPDLAAGVRREIHEELGLDLAPDQFVPMAAYLMTQRGPVLGSAAPTPGHGTGELVATAAFMVTVDMDFRTLQARRTHASPSKGRYENAGLVSIPVPHVASADPAALASAAVEFVHTLTEGHGARLDQRAYVAALYLAVDAFGAPAAVSAFAATPWWRMSWDDSLDHAGPQTPRLTLPPSDLVDDSSAVRLRTLATTLGLDISQW